MSKKIAMLIVGTLLIAVMALGGWATGNALNLTNNATEAKMQAGVSAQGDGGFMVIPQTMKELVDPSQIIVVGTVSKVVKQGTFAGYDIKSGAVLESTPTVRSSTSNATPLPVSSFPITDYEIKVETVLLDDGTLKAGKPLILRVIGQYDPKADNSASAFPMPRLGDRQLFFLGQNPDKSHLWTVPRIV